MEKNSFILYQKQKEIFNILTDNQAGKLIKAIFEYEENQQIPNLSGQTNMAFIAIKQELDQNRTKYIEKCKKNKENAKQRWNNKNATACERCATA